MSWCLKYNNQYSDANDDQTAQVFMDLTRDAVLRAIFVTLFSALMAV